ncbi:hypothetical protein [Streptomyces sp. NPDC048224]|uniref:hypothetical protein n=1 Tax=Streptomyces sp. NPDC048224 TaxID=3154500 RepID=UPI0033D887FF
MTKLILIWRVGQVPRGERATAVTVLRGERGMGKTYALRQERDAATAHDAYLGGVSAPVQ